MSFLASLAGPLIGAVGSLASGILNNDAAEDRQSAAQDFSAQQYATRYQTTVNDMRAAGLNPGLAYGGISGSSPTSSAASSAGFPDIGHSVNQARLQSAQIANIEADTSNKQASADLIAGQAAAAWSSATLNQANTDVSRETVKKVSTEIQSLNAQIANTHESTAKLKLEQEQIGVLLHKLTEEAEYLHQKGLTEQQIRLQIGATIHKIQAETSLTISSAAIREYDRLAAENLNNVGRNAKEAKPIFDILKSILSFKR